MSGLGRRFVAQPEGATACSDGLGRGLWDISGSACIGLNSEDDILTDNHAQERILMAAGTLHVTFAMDCAAVRPATVLRLFARRPRITISNP